MAVRDWMERTPMLIAQDAHLKVKPCTMDSLEHESLDLLKDAKKDGENSWPFMLRTSRKVQCIN